MEIEPQTERDHEEQWEEFRHDFLENREETTEMRVVDEETLEQLREQGMSISELLERVVDTGDYLLHGSPREVEELEPRQAKDEGGHDFSSAKAVYASTETNIVIFMSLFDFERIEPNESGSTSARAYYHHNIDMDEGGRWTAEFGMTQNVFDILEDGFVYVMDRGEFEQDPSGSNEFRSLGSVRPSLVVPVKKEDFPFFDEIKIIENE